MGLAPGLTVKGKRIPDTLEEWKYLAELYGKTLEQARDENSRLRHQVHTLQQKLDSCRRKKNV